MDVQQYIPHSSEFFCLAWFQGYSDITGKYDPPMYVHSAGEDWVMLTFDDNEADPFEYDVSEVRPVLLTDAILRNSGYAVYDDGIVTFGSSLSVFPLVDGSFMCRGTRIHFVHQLQMLCMVNGIDPSIIRVL